jgi:hypothetical protein
MVLPPIRAAGPLVLVFAIAAVAGQLLAHPFDIGGSGHAASSASSARSALR